MPNYLAAETLSANMIKPTKRRKKYLDFKTQKQRVLLKDEVMQHIGECAAVHNFLTRVSGMKVNFIFFLHKTFLSLLNMVHLLFSVKHRV